MMAFRKSTIRQGHKLLYHITELTIAQHRVWMIRTHLETDDVASKFVENKMILN